MKLLKIRKTKVPRFIASVLYNGIAAFTLFGCSSGSDDNNTSASSVPTAVPKPMSCADMASVSVSSSVIALPTSGAKITSATAIAASGSGLLTVGSYCKVTADITPIDPTAPPIKMEVNLPDNWNGKALMYGGGGYNGTILSTAGTLRLQPSDVAIPLGRGYVTFGSDSGHQGTSANGSFATNDEALRNYAYEALKKTRDTAGYLIKLKYGKSPDKVYFHGSSNGGKEAFAMIQKYPSDLDAAMIFWPATMLGTAELQFGRISRAFAQPGAYLNIAKRQVLLTAAIAACDGLDGVADHLISNARQCQQVFDPSTASINGSTLRCPSGADEGDNCLSDVQINALKTVASPITFSYTLRSGQMQYPGFNVWGTDLGISTSSATVPSTLLSQGLGTAAPAFPATAAMPFLHAHSDQFIKYFVTKDSSLNWTNVDPENPGQWQSRIADLTTLLDMSKTDLSEFSKRGGKILMMHGMADQIVPTQASERYYDQVVSTMGRETVQKFFKFYEIPGTEHSGVGSTFTPTWDVLGALDNWVVNGTAPAAPVVTDSYASPGRTRPLCEYPTYPKYIGGDIEKASSFTCSQ